MLPQAVALMSHFGGLENHKVTLAPAAGVKRDAEMAAETLREFCGEVTVLDLPFEGDGRWPQSPNMHWARTVDALSAAKNQDPWFWMELDCDPVMPHWADKIEQGWRAGRKPFYGKTVPTPHRNEAGAIIIEPGDLMMMGCCVYPPELGRFIRTDVLLVNLRNGINAQPWDVFLRGEMRTKGWQESELIGDRWNTVGYTVDSGKLDCLPGPTQFKYRDHSRTDISQAVVVHGCKDGSLGKLILEHGNLQALMTQNPVTSVLLPPVRQDALRPIEVVFAAEREDMKPVIGDHPPITTPSHLEAKLLATEIRELRTDLHLALKTMMEGQAAILRRLIGEEEPQAEPEPQAVVDIIPPTSPDIATVRGIVNDSPTPITSLANALQMDQHTLLAMVARPGSGLRLKDGIVSLAA